MDIQWPGVYCCSGEEEAAAAAAFKAVGCSAAALEELQLAGLEFAVRCRGCQAVLQARAACFSRNARMQSDRPLQMLRCAILPWVCAQLLAPAPLHMCSGCIGQGAYARVYQGVDGDCADVALKHESPPCPWEW